MSQDGPASYRFGPFLVDRTGYRVLRGETAVDLTPKLIDVLLCLLDRAGALVTKEALLDAVWPGANVTENALAQAVSELRQALGDHAARPRFIKTVARRGYRFIASVEPVPAAPPRAQPPAPASQTIEDARAIAVMDFTNVTGDADAAWLAAGIAETVAGDLRALGHFRVVDRRLVMEAARRTNGSVHDVAAELRVPLVVLGSYQRHGDELRITGRIVNVESGDVVADAKVDGPLGKIFELQDQIAAQFAREAGVPISHDGGSAGSRDTASLEAFRAFTEGLLQFETLDISRLPGAIECFERAIAIDARYALAHTGLATAELAQYETTRSDNVPDAELLERAIGHARHAVALDECLAEAHATLSLVLVSAWETAEAVAAARRAVSLEPGNWRHLFRLGHALWGEQRLRAAREMLALYPDFAFAHFQMAMVHVARGHLAEAEEVLRQGAAVQDRQIGRGERYPALGLHWLLGLVRLAQDDVEEAAGELEREREMAEPHRLYGREFAMNALHARGACLLRLGRTHEAIESFREALSLYPDHARTHIGLALVHRARASEPESDAALARARDAAATLMAARPIEAAVVRSQIAAAEGDHDAAVAELCAMLDQAPTGFAGWTIPVEPLLRQLVDTKAFRAVQQRLAGRAR